MALDLFKRVESRKGLFAVEKITLIYNLLTSILILFMFQRMDHPLHMLWDRAVIAAMTFLLMYLYRLAPCKFSAFVRIAIQMSLLSYWYPDTFEFNRVFPNLDHLFATAELDADQINEKVGQLVLEALGSVEPTESNPVELPFTRTDNAWGPASGAEQALSTALFSG